MSAGQIIRRLAYEPECPAILAEATQGNDAFFRALAAALTARQRHEDALHICDLLLDACPDNLDAALWAVQFLSAQGHVERALAVLLDMRKRGIDTDAVRAAVHAQVFAAAQAHGAYIASEAFERALKLCELLVELCPKVLLFHRSRLDTQAMLQKHQTQLAERAQLKHYNALNDFATFCLQQGDLEAELQCRLEIHRHALAQTQHSVSRVTNIAHALSRILGVETEHFDAAQIDVAKQLLADMKSIPTSPMPPGAEAASWERTMRMLLGTIDLDAVFTREQPSQPPLPLDFFSSSATPMTLDEVAERANECNAKIAFFTSASEEYCGRFGKNYINSILEYCDCGCLIFICLCTPLKAMPNIIEPLGINDRRVIFCCDHFDPPSSNCHVYNLLSPDPQRSPGCYYNASAALHADGLLAKIQIPMCFTGIDTVLQKGVTDFIERFADADVVFNKIGSQTLLGSQLVFNLVFVFPTENGLLFLEFLKRYLGLHLSWTEQPEFLDQVDLHMAKHHVVACGESPKIQYFDYYDINNVMFNRNNYQVHAQQMYKFRFLNMFISACSATPEIALAAEDVRMTA